MWAAYDYLLLFGDGMGGVSVDTVRWYFTGSRPGARLSADSRRDVEEFLPDLIREERRIQQEEWERRDREGGGAAGRRRQRRADGETEADEDF